jgi:hypothetical protein
MPSGGKGKVRHTRSYSGMGRFPNNVDAMRKASGVMYRSLTAPVARGGIGIGGGEYMKLVTGQRPLNDTLATRLARAFHCTIDDLKWPGSDKVPPSAPARTKPSPSRDLVPYQDKLPRSATASASETMPAATRGRPRKTPIEAPRAEPIEITIAVGGRLIGGVTMFDTRQMRRVIRDAFGGDDGE